MSQYLCLFSLILQGLHEEGECRQLEFWAGKGANIRDLFCTTPKVLKLHESQFWNILKILGEESTKGGPPTSHEGGGCAPASWAPCWPSGGHLLLYEVFHRKENHKQAFGTRLRRHEAKPWRNQSRALAELFGRGHFSGRGKSSPSSSPTLLSSGGGQSPSTSSPAPSPLQTLVHLLYPILYQNHKLVPVGC